MLFHHVKLALRLLVRNPRFALINILGLATGFASFLILWPYAQAELHTDSFHRHADKIARLGVKFEWTDDNNHWDAWNNASPFCCAGTTVKDKFGEVTDLTRLVPQLNFLKGVHGSDKEVLFTLKKEGHQKKLFHEKTTAYADPNFFRFFSFPLLLGSAEEVLAKPYSVVLSESCAKKYFPNSDPRNGVIYLNDSLPFQVGGVFKDLPHNTHFRFDILLSTAGIKAIDVCSWEWMGYSYIKVKNGDFKALDKKFKANSKDLFGPSDPKATHRLSYILDPLPELAFTHIRGYAYEVKSRHPLVLLNIMAFVILALAWVNYVSLSIHHLHQRLSEIGTRKAVGATTQNFLLQFLVEATLMNLISFLLALTLVQLIGAEITRLFGFYLVSWEAFSVESELVIGLVLLGGILTTGLYPVWMAAINKPLQILRKLKTNRGPVWVNWIVTLQYASALALLIWIIAVYSQLNFILHKDIGIDQSAILVIDSPIKKSPAFQTQLRTFLHQVRTIAGVQAATVSESVLGDISSAISVKKNPTTNDMALDINGGVDEHFIPLYNIRLLAGRNFGPDQPADRTTVLLSQDAVKRLGFVGLEQALGRSVILPNNGNATAEIIGIYQDYEFRPFLSGLREDGRGSLMTYQHHLRSGLQPEKISLKVNPARFGELLGQLNNAYRTCFGESLFEWRFLEENIEKHYRGEKMARNQIALFTAIAIFIACLGLLGTISNKAAEKTKEIGIRKILGAQPHHIAQLLLQATLGQVALAMLVGIPLAHYLVGQYLEKFSDRISLQWWHYGIPLLLLLLVMFCTVVSVLRKAANRNPAESLRYE